MTREEKQKAINALKISAPVKAVTREEFNDYIQTLNKVMDWLEQGPCEDAVSIDAVHDMLENLPVTVEDKWFNWLQKACLRLADLPRVTPKPRTGKWVFLHDTFSEWGGVTWHFKCSECGRRVTLGTFKMMARPTDNEDWGRLLETYPYCHCGAKMEN